MSPIVASLIGFPVLVGAWYDDSTPEELRRFVTTSGEDARIEFDLIDWTRAELKGTPDSGWMTPGDFDNWSRMRAAHDWRRAQRHKEGYNAKADALLNGFTMEEAEILGGAQYLDTKAQQIASNNVSYLYGLRRQAMDVAIKNNAGETLTMVGTVVALFPGYGTLIGGVMVIGGATLTVAQKNELMKRVASEKRTELIRARALFIKGEITEAQYLELQRQILSEAGQELAAFYGDEISNVLVYDPDMLPPSPPTWRERILGIFREPVPLVVAAGFAVVAGVSAWFLSQAFTREGVAA